MIYKIPGRGTIEIKNVILDYNGTIAIDGKIIKGIKEQINQLSNLICFHIITADTYGTVEKELENTNCKIVKISGENQAYGKLKYLQEIGKENTLCVGNGKIDQLMLKEAILGIAVMQEEGLCTDTLFAADIVCKSIMDVFKYFKNTNRLIATLRK